MLKNRSCCHHLEPASVLVLQRTITSTGRDVGFNFAETIVVSLVQVPEGEERVVVAAVNRDSAS